MAQPRVRPRTYQTYEEVIRLHVTLHIGHVPLVKLTPQKVQAWLGRRAKARVSARRCQYARVVLRTALQQAVKWNLVARNSAALVDPPRVERREITPFDPEQAKRLLEQCRGHRLGALFTVAVALGLRHGEALGLRWRDVDLETGVLHVRQALQRTAATLLLAQCVSPRVIMETLGHSQISLTMDTYSHVLPALQREAAEQMDAVLGADS